MKIPLVKKRLKVIIFLMTFLIFRVAVSIAAGELDPSFSIDGVTNYKSQWTDFDGGRSIVLQQNGKIVVAGVTGNYGSISSIIALRYNSNGTLDNTFGYGGITEYGAAEGNALAIQSDGKIIIVGTSNNSDILILRYNSEGFLDTSFGEDGVSLYETDKPNHGTGVAIQQDGKILVVGYTSIDPVNFWISDAVILRFNTDGTLDDTFGSSGIVVFPYATTRAIAVEGDGKIVVAGEGGDGLNYGGLVLRYNNDGTLDDTFDYDGIAVYNSDTTEHESLNGLSITREGKIIVVGTATNKYTNSYDVLILRYNIDGTLDNTFGSDGLVIYNRPEWYDEAYSVATQADGKIVVTGESYSQIATSLIVLRFNSDGTPDGTFAEDGLFTYEDPKFNACGGEALALQSDGKIVITGWGSAGVLTLRVMGSGFESLTLVSPNGEVTIASGSTYTIKWGAPQGITSFNLKYTLDNGLTWYEIARGLTGLSYSWRVPKPWNNKKKCLVKVIGYDVSQTKIGLDKSDVPFSIEVVKLTSPDGGEVFGSGETILIRWTTNETKKPVGRVGLYFTPNGVNWFSIGTLFGNPGSSYWTAPSKWYPSYVSCLCLCKIKLVLYDKYGDIVGSDKSDAPFYICKF